MTSTTGRGQNGGLGFALSLPHTGGGRSLLKLAVPQLRLRHGTKSSAQHRPEYQLGLAVPKSECVEREKGLPPTLTPERVASSSLPCELTGYTEAKGLTAIVSLVGLQETEEKMLP